jgi:hypothetical protein
VGEEAGKRRREARKPVPMSQPMTAPKAERALLTVVQSPKTCLRESEASPQKRHFRGAGVRKMPAFRRRWSKGRALKVRRSWLFQTTGLRELLISLQLALKRL